MKDASQNRFLKNLLNNKGSARLEPVQFLDNLYINNLFGVSFWIPEGWHIVSFNQFEKTINETKFQGLFQILKDNSELIIDQPMCLVTKYDLDAKEYDGIISPTINFDIIPKEDELSNISLIDYANKIEINPEVISHHLLKNFRITRRGNVYERNGFPYILHETEYLFEHEELESPIMVEMDILNIDYGEYFLDFSMTDCKVQNQLAREEFKKVIESIKLKINSG